LSAAGHDIRVLQLGKGTEMETLCFYSDFFGHLCLVEEEGMIVRLFFARPEDVPASHSASPQSPLLSRAAVELEEYFSGRRRNFDLPLNPRGTDFQRKVWTALRAIPYGETRSYAQIAMAAGNPKACRAVGMANNKNPIGIIIPCHRVIGSNGSLVGYAGGLERKRFLLDLEAGRKISVQPRAL
jgi:methylated-DNA-[protein]-cysteine S-methyltransferase